MYYYLLKKDNVELIPDKHSYTVNKDSQFICNIVSLNKLEKYSDLQSAKLFKLDNIQKLFVQIYYLG